MPMGMGRGQNVGLSYFCLYWSLLSPGTSVFHKHVSSLSWYFVRSHFLIDGWSGGEVVKRALARRGIWGSSAGLTTHKTRDRVFPVSKSRYGWNKVIATQNTLNRTQPYLIDFSYNWNSLGDSNILRRLDVISIISPFKQKSEIACIALGQGL